MKLEEYRTELEKSIAATEQNRAGLKNFEIDPEKDGLPNSKAELAQINAYLDPASEVEKSRGLADIENQSAEIKAAAKRLEGGIFKGLDGLSPEELEAKAANLNATKEDESDLAAVFRDAGIETPEDIPEKLPPKAQIRAYTWLMSMAPDATARENIRKEINNLRSGSGRIDASRLELQNQAEKDFAASTQRVTARTGQLTAATGVSNAKRGWAALRRDLASDRFEVYQGEQDRVENVFTELMTSIYALDDEGKPTTDIDYDEKRFSIGVNKAVGSLRARLESLKGIGNKPAHDQIRSALDRTYSVAIQAMAESEEYGSWTDILADGEISFIDEADEFMSRVYIAKKDADGEPTLYAIKSLASGLKVEETIPASAIKNVFGSQGYTDFRKQLGVYKKEADKKARLDEQARLARQAGT